jgi:hypothetical protein
VLLKYKIQVAIYSKKGGAPNIETENYLTSKSSIDFFFDKFKI